MAYAQTLSVRNLAVAAGNPFPFEGRPPTGDFGRWSAICAQGTNW